MIAKRAFEELLAGRKLRLPSWPADDYIKLNEDGTIFFTKDYLVPLNLLDKMVEYINPNSIRMQLDAAAKLGHNKFMVYADNCNVILILDSDEPEKSSERIGLSERDGYDFIKHGTPYESIYERNADCDHLIESWRE